MVHAAQFDGDFGHAEDDATGFVLGHGGGALIFHFPQASGAVVSHAGHDHADGVASGIACDGFEQDVHRGPVAIDAWALLDLNHIDRPRPLQRHVEVARRQQGFAWCDGVAVPGFGDRYFTGLIEALGEGGGEMLGHMLDDENARRVAWEGGQHVS